MKRLRLSALLLVLSFCTCGPAFKTLQAQADIAVSSPTDYITKLQDIHVDDGGNGFAVGRCGVLLTTSTDGQLWDPMPAPTAESLNTIACPPSGCATAVMATEEGMFRFSNGSWSALATENGDLGGTLHWLTEDIIVHETSGDVYYRSVDGGLSWQAVSLPDFQRANMHFIDASTGFVWVDKDLYKTTDAGATFDPVGYTDPNSIRKQTWLDDQRGWIFASDQLFYGTTDGGLSWTQLNDEQQLTSVNWMEALSATHLVGAQVTTFRLESLDGGVTWTRGSFLEQGNKRVNERYHRRGNAFFTVGDANQIMYSPAGFTDFAEQDPIERHDR
ncbi:MAG: hypothetical protein AAF597_07175, partial [Bacteroidota bacterium]